MFFVDVAPEEAHKGNKPDLLTQSFNTRQNDNLNLQGNFYGFL